MYTIGCLGPGGPVTTLHKTASEAMLELYDLRRTTATELRVTDAAGQVLSEVQLIVLTLVERLTLVPELNTDNCDKS
ncbi:hypothetical protein ABS772_14970 [Methylorubrum podarium]|uniref:Uncharacterized protein n=1 Tax=Methylorubrum podarium TaxID=200476 RepID=A0ABV1QPE4_9HYPH